MQFDYTTLNILWSLIIRKSDIEIMQELNLKEYQLNEAKYEIYKKIEGCLRDSIPTNEEVKKYKYLNK